MQTEIPIRSLCTKSDGIPDDQSHFSRCASLKRLNKVLPPLSGEGDLCSTSSFSWTAADEEDSCSVFSAKTSNNVKICKLEYPDGSVYIGEVDATTRLPHGNGVITSPAGDKCEAAWINGVLHGEITYRYASGGVYVGFSSQGKKTGRGRLEVEGAVYEGLWSDDKPHGEGTFKDFENEFEYSGQWKDGQMDGSGTLKIRGGKVYTGNWIEGKREGNGRLQGEDGSCYDGSWVSDQAQGTGTYVWPDGTKYVGTWSKGCLDGRGRMTFPCDPVQGTTEVYEGDWVANSRQGKGILKFPDGSFYEGSWSNNCPEGAGVFVNPHGVLFRGIWREGILDALLSEQLDDRGVPVGVLEGSSYQLQDDLKGINTTSSLLDNRVVVPLPDPGSPDMMARFPRPRVFSPDEIAEDYFHEESSAFISSLKPDQRRSCGSGYLYHSRFAAEYWTHNSKMKQESPEVRRASEPLKTNENPRIVANYLMSSGAVSSPATPLATSQTQTVTLDQQFKPSLQDTMTTMCPSPYRPAVAASPTEAFKLVTRHSPVSLQTSDIQPTFGIRPFRDPHFGESVSAVFGTGGTLTRATFSCVPSSGTPVEGKPIESENTGLRTSQRPVSVVYPTASPPAATPIVSANSLPAPYSIWNFDHPHPSRFTTTTASAGDFGTRPHMASYGTNLSKRQMAVVPAQRIESICHTVSQPAEISRPMDRRPAMFLPEIPVYLPGKVYDSRLNRESVKTVFVDAHSVDMIPGWGSLEERRTVENPEAWTTRTLNENTLKLWNKYLETAADKQDLKADAQSANIDLHSIPSHAHAAYSFRPQVSTTSGSFVNRVTNTDMKTYQRVDHLGNNIRQSAATRSPAQNNERTKVFEAATPTYSTVAKVDTKMRLRSWGGGETGTRQFYQPRRCAEIVERIVEVPEIVYRDKIIEKIVEVPEIKYETIVKEVPVPQYRNVPTVQETVTLVEVESRRNIPVPVESVSEIHFTFPQIRAVKKTINYPVYVPRYIDVPVPAESLTAEALKMCNFISTELDKVSSELQSGVPGAAIAYEQLSNLLFDMYDEYEGLQELKLAVRPPAVNANCNFYNHEMREEDLAVSSELSRRAVVPVICGLGSKNVDQRVRSEDQCIPTTARVENRAPTSAGDLSRKITDTCEEWGDTRGRLSCENAPEEENCPTLHESPKLQQSNLLRKSSLEIDDEAFLAAEAAKVEPDTDTAVICFEPFNARLSQGTYVAGVSKDQGTIRPSRSEEDELDEEDSRELDSQFRGDLDYEEDVAGSQDLEEPTLEGSSFDGRVEVRRVSQKCLNEVSSLIESDGSLDDETFDN